MNIKTPSLFLIATLFLVVCVASADAQQVLNIRSFGAVGDGSHDDTGAIQAALDAARGKGDTVYVPATSSFYKITDRLFVWSDEILKGDGKASRIVRVDPTGPSPLKFGAMVVGAYGGPARPNSPFFNPHFPVRDIPAGSTTLTFENPGDASQFHAGDVIFVWDPHGSSTRVPHPLHSMENQVVSVAGATLTTRYPFADDYTSDSGNPVMVGSEPPAPQGPQDKPDYVVHDTTVEDLSIEQTDLGKQYTILAAMWNCTFENLWIRGSNLLGIDGAFSTLKNIDGDFGVCPIEIGDFSNNLEVDHFIAKRVALPDHPKVAYGFVAHDSGEDITFDGCEITDYAFPGSIGMAGFETTMQRTRFVNCVVHDSQGPGFAVRPRAEGTSIRGCIVEQSQGLPFAIHANSVELQGDRPGP